MWENTEYRDKDAEERKGGSCTVPVKLLNLVTEIMCVTYRLGATEDLPPSASSTVNSHLTELGIATTVKWFYKQCVAHCVKNL